MSAPEVELTVAFVGAGTVNFGGAAGGPWDHATRLERIGNVAVVAIVEPDMEKAKAVMSMRKAGARADMYRKCELYASLAEFLSVSTCQVVFLGTQPFTRGSLKDGRDLELKVVTAGIHLLVEKPLSVDPVDEDFRSYCSKVTDVSRETGSVVCVGYMLRYHRAVEKMRELIREHGGHVMAVSARFHLAYPGNTNAAWWDPRRSGGPVVEAGTHFLDLARYVAGEVDVSSVQVQCVRDGGPGSPGHLARVPPACEAGVPPPEKIPRVTMATWRFASGAAGSLTHVIGLHGARTERTFEVFMDGLHLVLAGVQTPQCRLLVRAGDAGEYVTHEFGDDDPYERELRTFLRACRGGGDDDDVRSTYDDATRTHEFAMTIRAACDA